LTTTEPFSLRVSAQILFSARAAASALSKLSTW
jgi:hypothetical protein